DTCRLPPRGPSQQFAPARRCSAVCATCCITFSLSSIETDVSTTARIRCRGRGAPRRALGAVLLPGCRHIRLDLVGRDVRWDPLANALDRLSEALPPVRAAAAARQVVTHRELHDLVQTAMFAGRQLLQL